LLFGKKLINGLKRWNIGQQIREEGPRAHIAKRDTPTMGGLLIIASVIISTLMWARLSGLYIWITILATLGFGAVGFADDYIKLVKRGSRGLAGPLSRDEIFSNEIFMERQYSVFQEHRRSQRHQRHRSVSLPGADH